MQCSFYHDQRARQSAELSHAALSNALKGERYGWNGMELKAEARKSSQSVKPRRLPFTVSGSMSYASPSSYSSSSPPSSSSLGSSRLYVRGRVLRSDRFTRATTRKPDLDHQSLRFLSLPHDYDGSDSLHSGWNLASLLVSSSLSYDHRSWADSSPGSHSKLNVSERRLGTYSGGTCGHSGRRRDQESQAVVHE